MRKVVVFSAVLLLLALIVAGGFVWYYLLSPQYSLLKVESAVGEGKRIEGEKKNHPDATVDLPGLAQGAKPLTLTYVPSGKFMMGSPDSEANRGENEGPRHRVHITQPFWMGKYEITNAQFEAFVKDSNYQTTAEKGSGGSATWRNPGLPDPADGKGLDQPVVQVTWDDAKAYCDWLSQKTGEKFSLPTEAQWEYACRAGSSTMYPWGDEPNGACQYANGWNQENKGKWGFNWDGFPCSDGYLGPAPVGRFQPNAFGLHDMIGNVFEWCADDYDATYYAQSPKEDPTGPPASNSRVLRGGSCYNLPANYRSATRSRDPPDSRFNYVGFRLLRTP